VPLPPPFRSPDDFRAAFVAGLQRLVEEPGLGAFILVLANANFDADIQPLLAPRLAARFAELGDRCRKALRRGRPIDAPPDDLLVFLKLLAIGIDDLPTTTWRRAGPWEIQFNPVRALRPARSSAARIDQLVAPFDPRGFHFDRPFLRPETLWEGELLGWPGRLLYNKFPFVPLHGLWVPEPGAGWPQLLAEQDHARLWEATAVLGAALPGFGFGYNSYGAHASVNHLHFQSFLRAEPLPVEDGAWAHNGGPTPYPVGCRVFSEPDSAWDAIAGQHAGNQPYHLVYRPGRLYLLPRAFQGTRPHAAWTAGLAWYELAGGVTTFDAEDFERLDAAAIAAELAALRPEA